MGDISRIFVGLVVVIVAALCCIAPALVVSVGLIGLSVISGLLDSALLPSLVIFIGLITYALWRRSKQERG